MTPTIIKEHNRVALLRVLAGLFAMVGLVGSGTIALLPRRLRLQVLRLLRPAESAALRLIVVAAQGMDVPVPPSRSASSSSKKSPKRSAKEAKPSFPLIERLQRTGPPARKHAPGPGPRMSFFDGSDPVFETPPAPPSPEDLMDASGLCRRLIALQMVLEDLPKYAMRLARWDARQKARREAGAGRGRTKPIRPGRPPGFRARMIHEVDEILRECHDLALRALVPPDTS